jgi:hypothetical protein
MERTTPIAAQRPVTVPALLHSVPLKKKALFLKRKSKASVYALQLILVVVTHAHAHARLW